MYSTYPERASRARRDGPPAALAARGPGRADSIAPGAPSLRRRVVTLATRSLKAGALSEALRPQRFGCRSQRSRNVPLCERAGWRR